MLFVVLDKVAVFHLSYPRIMDISTWETCHLFFYLVSLATSALKTKDKLISLIPEKIVTLYLLFIKYLPYLINILKS